MLCVQYVQWNLVSQYHQGQTKQVLTISVVFNAAYEVEREQGVLTLQEYVLFQTITIQI